MAYAPSSALPSHVHHHLQSVASLCALSLCFHVPPITRSIATRNNSRRHYQLYRSPRLYFHFIPHVSADAALSETEESQQSENQEAQPSLSPEEEDEANVREILRVLELLQKKRDMPFNEVRLTVMIEDPRAVERRKQLGIEDKRGCSREDMASALSEVHEGRIPSDRHVLRELTKEMLDWPNFEDEVDPQKDPSQSPYAKTTDTGVDPRVAAQKMKVDWDTAAEIQTGKEEEDVVNVPPAVGFSVLYVVSAIPILIGVSAVAILFFNSLR